MQYESRAIYLVIHSNIIINNLKNLSIDRSIINKMKQSTKKIKSHEKSLKFWAQKLMFQLVIINSTNPKGPFENASNFSSSHCIQKRTQWLINHRFYNPCSAITSNSVSLFSSLYKPFFLHFIHFIHDCLQEGPKGKRVQTQVHFIYFKCCINCLYCHELEN